MTETGTSTFVDPSNTLVACAQTCLLNWLRYSIEDDADLWQLSLAGSALVHGIHTALASPEYALAMLRAAGIPVEATTQELESARKWMARHPIEVG